MNKIFTVAAASVMLLTSISGAFAIGAIAVDDTEGNAPSAAGYGYSLNHSTKEAALAAAMRKCEGANNQNCKEMVWFETCGAYASSREKYGIGYGATKAAATRQAMNACGSGCKLVISVCE